MTINIQEKKIIKEKGVVILPVAEYEKLLQKNVPTYYLIGKEAERLDALVSSGLKEYRAGKTKKIKSLADLE